MGKDMFITADLRRIKDQIAEAARDTAEKNTDSTAAADRPVSVFAGLSDETANALRERLRDYEYSRRDLQVRLHELAASVARREEELSRNTAAMATVRSGLDSLSARLDRQQDPDEFSADFQFQLASSFKELEHIRIELIDIQSRMPEQKTEAAAGGRNNLFAELDSVSFGQLFRIGSALLLPLLLTIFFCGLLLAAAIILTFRLI